MADVKPIHEQLIGTALAAKGREFGDKLISMLDAALPAGARKA
jgi:hypothetical protein